MKLNKIYMQYGVSLIELLITVAVIGCGIVIVLSGYGRYVKNINNLDIRWRASQIIENIKEEILVKKYKDDSKYAVFGPEPGEIQKVRSSLNDIDDYNELYSEVTDERGITVPGYENYFIKINVYNYDIKKNENTTKFEDTGIRKIIVQVLYKNKVIQKIAFLKSDYR